MSDTVVKPMSEPARRLEIFTGAGRRRTWSAEQKAAIVAESVGGRESVSAVARRHGLTPQQLFAWRRQAQRARAGASRMAFAPVVLEASRPGAVTTPIAQGHSVGSPVIEIVIGAAMVRVPSGTEFATLQVVLRAVTAAGS